MDEMRANRTLLHVVECGSFSAAANKLDVSVTTVMRLVNGLEDHLGVKLLHRSTNALSLTEAGSFYREKMRDLLTNVEFVKREVSSYQKHAKGLLKVHLRQSVGSHVIVPALPRFLRQHPGIRLDLTLTDERANLIAEEIDVAVWLGKLEDSSLVARKLCWGNRVICCSPAYGLTYGYPRTPDELVQHNCIIYRGQGYGNVWQLSRDGVDTVVEVQGNVETRNAAAIATMAVAGMGVAVLQETVARGFIRRGELTIVLPEYSVHPAEPHDALWAVHPGLANCPPKTRVFGDFLVDLFNSRQH